MLARIGIFIFFELLGAALAGLLGLSSEGWLLDALLGALLGAFCWLLLDTVYASRAWQWLGQSHTTPLPWTWAPWAPWLNRVQRLLRSQSRNIEELQHRLQDFLSALQSSPNGVVLLDSECRIEWCNQMAAQHFGFDVQRDVQQHIVHLLRDPVFTAYLARRAFDQEMLMTGRQSTSLRPVRLSLQAHPYGDKRLLLLSRDVTALQQAEAMRRNFVANVSHEIRTPLTVLAGFIETLQMLDLTPQERGNYLALMAQQSQRMQNLVDDLLTLSRLEGSPDPMLDSWSAVPALWQQLEQDARALAQLVAGAAQKPHQLHFVCTFDGDIAGVASELHSAMANLVGNAIRYTPAGGRIEVSFRQLPSGQAEFAVVDTGPGIAAQHIGRLTERFYRVDRSRSRETGGTGLGLAIVKHVVQRHGASLHIDSQLGQGARFCIVFPASRLRLGHH